MTTPSTEILEETKRLRGIRAEIDCGDSSCRFAKDKSGMRTNGRCRCTRGRDYSRVVYLAQRSESLADALDVAVKALELYQGQASKNQRGPTFYSEADEALAEMHRLMKG
jgi:hypothetical protein